MKEIITFSKHDAFRSIPGSEAMEHLERKMEREESFFKLSKNKAARAFERQFTLAGV